MADFKRCNKCGKELLEYEIPLSINTYFGYGSVHDGDRLVLDLCQDCVDELVDMIKEKCTYSVIAEDDFD